MYVYDLVIAGASTNKVAVFKEEMKELFQMSDLGVLSYYLGIEVKKDGNGITVHQAAYAKKLLKKANMAGCNPCVVPMEARRKLSKKGSRSTPVDKTFYRSVIESLRYLVHTYPDLAFAVVYVSRYIYGDP